MSARSRHRPWFGPRRIPPVLEASKASFFAIVHSVGSTTVWVAGERYDFPPPFSGFDIFDMRAADFPVRP